MNKDREEEPEEDLTPIDPKKIIPPSDLKKDYENSPYTFYKRSSSNTIIKRKDWWRD